MATQKQNNENEFFSWIVHQIRTPLTSMRWFLEMLLEKDAVKFTQEQESLLRKVYRLNAVVRSLVNKFLIVNRIQAGQLALNKTQIDVKKIAELALKESDGFIEEHSHRVKMDESSPLPPCFGDADMVREVLVNLITNAVQYSDANSEIAISFRPEKEFLKVSVSNNGIGIPEDVKGEIFKKFYRTPEAQKHNPGGSGIGLYIAHSVMELMGGKLWLENDETKKTTFSFTLPLQP